MRFLQGAELGRAALRFSLCLASARPAPGAALLGTARSWRGIISLTHLAREGRMTVTIGRRELLVALGGAAAAWPLAARAQPPAMPVIGDLSIRSSGTDAQFLVSFRQGLSEVASSKAENVAVEYRYAEGQADRLASLATDLVRRKVAIIVTTGGPPAALAAKDATSTIPIVFVTGGDPVREGLVQSFNRPGGNL